MPIRQALQKFSENGILELENSSIFLENIRQLERRVKQLKEDKPEILLLFPCYIWLVPMEFVNTNL